MGRDLHLPGSRFRQHEGYLQLAAGAERLDQGQRAALLHFAEHHRAILNAKLRQRVRLLETSLLPLVVLPECRRLLEFSVKRKFLEYKLYRLIDAAPPPSQQHEDEDDEDGAGRGVMRVNVGRETIVEDSMRAFRSHSPEQLRRSALEVGFLPSSPPPPPSPSPSSSLSLFSHTHTLTPLSPCL